MHFDRRFSTPADIGYKALAVNVSDIAAMGGAPRLALLSLMLPPAMPLADVDGLLDGLLQVAAATGVTLAGGNITRSPGPLVVDVTVTGSVRPRRILTRSGGHARRQPLRQRHDRGGGRRPRAGCASTACPGPSCPRMRTWPTASRGIAVRSRERASARSSAERGRPGPAWT